jgi:hypothetical protein
MAQIGLSFTPSGGSPVYSIVFDNFGDNAMPRTYQSSASFDSSANGASLIQGPAYKQKYMWAISSIVPNAVATNLDALFADWDQDRSAGLAAACGVTDTTFGATVNASAVFSTPPSYTYMGPQYTMVSFGLMEI